MIRADEAVGSGAVVFEKASAEEFAERQWIAVRGMAPVMRGGISGVVLAGVVLVR